MSNDTNEQNGGFDEIYISPFLSPLKYVSDMDTIIPPTMVRMTSPYITPIIDSTELLLTDIYVPNIQIMSNGEYYSGFHVPINLYDDACDIETIKEDVVKIFYNKFLDKWLYNIDQSKFLLKYLKVVDGKVKVIEGDKDDYRHDTQEIVDKKIDFIEHNVLSKDETYMILKRFVEGTRLSWCELTKNKYFIREAMEKTVENKLKKMLRND